MGRLPNKRLWGLGVRALGLSWVLPPLSNSWIIAIIWLYIALNRTPNIACYWGGGGGSTQGLRIVRYIPKSRAVGLDGHRQSLAVLPCKPQYAPDESPEA